MVKNNKTKNNKAIKKIDNIIKYLNFMNKPNIKILNLFYYFILLIIFLSLLLRGYNYSVLNVDFIRDFKNNNDYLAKFLFFIIVLIFIKLIIDPLHNITKFVMYKLPIITFTVYSFLLLYIIYNTYNIQKIFISM
tara:strand:+ start:211 stop:615 length:405 start_codon:yes stop_codon:yes gene_type:complete